MSNVSLGFNTSVWNYKISESALIDWFSNTHSSDSKSCPSFKQMETIWIQDRSSENQTHPRNWRENIIKWTVFRSPLYYWLNHLNNKLLVHFQATNWKIRIWMMNFKCVIQAMTMISACPWSEYLSYLFFRSLLHNLNFLNDDYVILRNCFNKTKINL